MSNDEWKSEEKLSVLILEKAYTSRKKLVIYLLLWSESCFAHWIKKVFCLLAPQLQVCNRTRGWLTMLGMITLNSQWRNIQILVGRKIHVDFELTCFNYSSRAFNAHMEVSVWSIPNFVVIKIHTDSVIQCWT